MSAKTLLLCVTFGFIAASCATSDPGSLPPVFDGDGDSFISDSNLGADAAPPQRTTAPDTSASSSRRDATDEGEVDIQVPSPDAADDSAEVIASSDSAVDNESDQSSAPDDGVEQDETEVNIADLYGSTPTTALGPPAFTAINSDESTRTIANLVGSPTILWFFPFAGSPG